MPAPKSADPTGKGMGTLCWADMANARAGPHFVCSSWLYLLLDELFKSCRSSSAVHLHQQATIWGFSICFFSFACFIPRRLFPFCFMPVIEVRGGHKSTEQQAPSAPSQSKEPKKPAATQGLTIFSSLATLLKTFARGLNPRSLGAVCVEKRWASQQRTLVGASEAPLRWRGRVACKYSI